MRKGSVYTPKIYKENLEENSQRWNSEIHRQTCGVIRGGRKGKNEKRRKKNEKIW
jgi:hypothetical protein